MERGGRKPDVELHVQSREIKSGGIGSFMTMLKCQICNIVFEGRSNRKYCSIDCRRKAEMAQREIKKEERRQEMLAAMTPEERAFYDSCREWEKSLSTWEELCPEIKKWEFTELKSWVDDLTPAQNISWDLLPTDLWDIPVIDWNFDHKISKKRKKRTA